MISNTELAIRLGLGFLAGTIIGFERSSRYQIASLRTHVLISTGATLLMILSIKLPLELSPVKSGDPARIAAQVVTSIGFLGAGAIIRLGNNVKGLTTAASLWYIAAVGLAVGAGMYLAAAIAEAAGILALIGMNTMEQHFFPAKQNKTLDLYYKNNIPDTKEAVDILKKFGVRIQSMNMGQNVGKSKGAHLRILVGMPENIDLTSFINTLRDIKKIERLEINEKY